MSVKFGSGAYQYDVCRLDLPVQGKTKLESSVKRRFVQRWIAVAVFALLSTCASAQVVARIGAVSAAGVSDELKHAVEDKGYRITLEDGWKADFWFAKQLKAAPKDVSGALYPELTNGEFIGLVSLPKGMADYRGQAIPEGVYTLRYQLLPQDGNHLGVSPNPDFVLAIPASSDSDPEQELAFKKLVALSAKATGGNHPAVIALDTAGEPGTIAKNAQDMTVLTVPIATASGGTEKLGIVVKGTAAQ